MMAMLVLIIEKYHIIRFLVDLLGILIALRFFLINFSNMKKYRMRKMIGKDLGRGFQVFSTNKCTISWLRFNLQIEENYLPEMGVYFGIRVKDYFRKIVIHLPYEIIFPLKSKIDGVVIQGKEGDSFITIDCQNKDMKKFELPNSYFKVNGWFEQYRSKKTFFFQISYLWGAGIPHAKSKSLSLGNSHVAWFGIDSNEMFSPKIEELEIDFKCLDDRFSLELKETVPSPDVFFEREVRWISGMDRRPHSSLEVTFVDKIEFQQTDHESFKQGVFLAVSSSLALACGLDVIWKILDLLKL